MPLFSPETTIRFLSNTGIDDSNKPNFTSNAAMTSWLIGKTKYTKTCLSYQRADERQFTSVDLNYYDLLSCDAMMWQNAGTSDMWLVANITDLEWVNPNLTRVYFKVDAYCSFCGNITWADSYCFVEREHVQNDWIGGEPNWNNIGLDEGIALTPDYILDSQKQSFTPDTFIILSPYDEEGNADFKAETKYGIYDGINELVTQSPTEVQSYLNALATGAESKLEQVIGVISLPHEMQDSSTGTVTPARPWTLLSWVNNAKSYSSQFCNITVESMLGGSKCYKPELMEPGTWVFSWVCHRVGMSCGVSVIPGQYAGVGMQDNTDLAYTIEGTPMGAFIGNAFAQYISGNNLRLISNGLSWLSGLGPIIAGGVGAVAMGVASPLGAIALGGIAALSSAKGTIQEIQTAKKSSAFVGGTTSSSDVNLAVAQQGYGFYVRVYTPMLERFRSIDAFFDRFGYKVCKLKTPNINTRPCWNYVKTSEAHISGSIPYIYKQQLESLLNNGCTFWNVAARDIGDYSNPEENKG